MSTYIRLHMGLLRLHPGPFHLLENQTDVQRCRFDICIKLTAPPVQSRHKCTGDIELGLMPVVTTIPGLLLRLSVFLRQLLRFTNRLHNTHRVEQGSNQYSQDGPSLRLLPLHQQGKLGRHPRHKHNLLLTQPPLDFLEATSSKVGSSSPGWTPTTQKLP